ncbi:hypothetical protein FCIRC_9000 [Fusarium circinatum]|uniref:Uncharacterized protein n=1 Tax=Fusarium circinatum TaxID=48490 RepID=A0A8H5WP78_FUSCI|nr:hypothetical protein FCIRC_9000 [Fusarium circinatum]
MSYTEINTLAELVHDFKDKCISFHDKYLIVSGPEEKVQVGQAWADTARSALEFQLWLLQQAKQAKQSSIELPAKTQEAIDEHLRVPSFDDEIVRLSNSVNQTRDALKSAKVPFHGSLNDFFRAKGFGKARTPSASTSVNAPQSSGSTRLPLASRDPNARITRSSGLAPARSTAFDLPTGRVTRSSSFAPARSTSFDLPAGLATRSSGLAPARSTAFDLPTGRVTRSSAANAPANKLPELKSPAVPFPAASTASKLSKTVPTKRATPASNAQKSLKQGARPEYDSDDEPLTLLLGKKASAAKPVTPAPAPRRSTRGRSSVNYAEAALLVSDGDDDDFEASEEDEDNDEPVIVSGANIFTDENGLIHVGKQDTKIHVPAIKSAPIDHAIFELHDKVRKNVMHTDKKRIGLEDDLITDLLSGVRESLTQSLIHTGENMVKRHCDYMGLQLHWSLSPCRPSLEALYHFSKQNGQVAYHATPNVGLIVTALNWAKGRSAPLILPLASAWLKAITEEKLEDRISQGSWIMNSIGNTGLLEKTLGCYKTHKDRVADWSQWSSIKQKEALVALRTGERPASIVQHLVEATGGENPIRTLIRGNVPAVTFAAWRGHSKPPIHEWETIYHNLISIARRYGLTDDEFESSCTLSRPNGAGRVFFPYHVLAQPQALAVGWDWHILHYIASEALHEMRRKCNRHAEAAGLGEPEVDAVIYIYWTGHYLCDKIHRWGFPVVPWSYHQFRASLCKKQMHGIAMKFGITKFTNFDPVEDIDLGQSTVTIDAQITNLAMYKYESSTWDGIRETIRMVPLYHPLWRPDSKLGESPWVAPGAVTVIPVMPTPEFDLPLLPIELWVPDDGTSSLSGPWFIIADINCVLRWETTMIPSELMLTVAILNKMRSIKSTGMIACDARLTAAKHLSYLRITYKGT